MILPSARRLAVGFLALALVLPGVSPRPASDPLAAAQAGSQPQAEALLQGSGWLLTWEAPEPSLHQLPDGVWRVEMPGFALIDRPGLPRLPFVSRLIALPPEGDARVELEQIEARDLDLPAPLEAGQFPSGVLRDAAGQLLGGDFASEQPAGVAPAKGLPSQPVELELLGSVRGIRLARVTFYPLLPAGGAFRLATRVAARIEFSEPMAPTAASLVLDPLQALVRSAVINPQQAVPGPKEQTARSAAPQGLESGPLLAVEIDRPGLYALGYADIQAAGFPLEGVDPALLRLTRSGDEVGAEWQGDADPVFEPGERLVFYGEPRFSRWTSRDTYFLSYDALPGARMAERPASPGSRPSGRLWAVQTVETNQIYTPDCLCAPIPSGRDGDRWVWLSLQRLSGQESTPKEIPFELGPVDSGVDARLSVWLLGSTDLPAAPDHRVRVQLNGAPLGEVEWDGKQAVRKDFSVPAGLLQGGENRLALSLPGLPQVSTEAAWLDAFQVIYPVMAGSPGSLVQGEVGDRRYRLQGAGAQDARLYDVTDSSHPVRLTGFELGGDGSLSWGDSAESGAGGDAHRYWAGSQASTGTPAALRMAAELRMGAARGADLLILAPAGLIPGLAGLTALRQAQGLIVAVEDVQAVYDRFGDGQPSPEALRNYLGWAYGEWQPRPLYVLLVGDGSSDPKRYQSGTPPTLIPPYLAEVDPWAGEVAADNRFVAVDGPDLLPDMFIGRLPVNSPEELAVVVAKILSRETQAAFPNRAILVSDNPDGAGDFHQFIGRIREEHFGPSWTVPMLAFDPQSGPAQAFRQSLLDTLDAGSDLVVYAGHASIHQWGAENFIHLDDLPSLANAARLPVVLEMTCVTAAFQVPAFPTLDEALLRQAGGGAAAVWGPTGLGIEAGHQALAGGFLDHWLNVPGATLGSAAAAGKLRLALEAPDYPDLLDTYTLLGDPASRPGPGEGRYHQFLPVLNRP